MDSILSMLIFYTKAGVCPLKGEKRWLVIPAQAGIQRWMLYLSEAVPIDRDGMNGFTGFVFELPLGPPL
jgi:hypothetical protein